MSQVIIVGGGLAGLSAAHTVLERGGNVLVLDKKPFFGGNSTKATSGINGALTNAQVNLKIDDSAKAFYEDTIKSARDLARPDLIEVLTYQSSSAIEWLKDAFNLDLSLVSRLGGHTNPRTHRGHDAKFPGMAITYALMEKLEEFSESMPDRVKIIKEARVTRLLREHGTSGPVIGCVYEYEGNEHEAYGPVVLATGGYAADFDSPDSLLKKYRPDVLQYPTTNGDHCTGDGHKLILAAGGNGIDMEKVQIHPTGLVDPKQPDAKIKFLCAEAIRGVGAILLNANGERFCDELGHRDYVSNEMLKNKFPIRLVLNKKGSEELAWHCKHYVKRGLMKRIEGIDNLAKEFGLPKSKLQQTIRDYNDIAAGKKSDPFGKKFFHNTPINENEYYHVALMQPVLHYTMGGIEIDSNSEVLGKDKQPIGNVFACGELAGGVHGANRLGGSSLAGCVVYGRVAGNSASKALLANLINNSHDDAVRRLGQVQSHLIDSRILIDTSNQKVTLEFNMNANNVNSSQGTDSNQSSAPKPAVTGEKDKKQESLAPKDNKEFKFPTKKISLDEVAKHATAEDVWVAINGQVLDVTKFLSKHPGGADAILLYAGKEASEAYNMLHEPNYVEKYAADTVIGTYEEK